MRYHTFYKDEAGTLWELMDCEVVEPSLDALQIAAVTGELPLCIEELADEDIYMMDISFTEALGTTTLPKYFTH